MPNHAKDETGKIYGKWTVLELGKERRGEKYWKCRCECGAVAEVRGSALRSGRSNCCFACGRPKPPNVIGKEFGDWIVLEFVGKGKVKSRCKRCGREFIRSFQAIKTGSTTGCKECQINSKQEEETAKWLKDNNKEYVREVELPIKLETGGYPRIDFKIKVDDEWCFLEINGKQHYVDVGRFGKLQRETTDRIKKDWCSTHSIRLFEIRYDQNVNEELTKIFAQDNTVPSPNGKV